MGCPVLQLVYIPPSVHVLESGCFSGCSSLTDLHLLPGLRSIGEYAFRNCRTLIKIIIPPGLTEIRYVSASVCFCLSVPRRSHELTPTSYTSTPLTRYGAFLGCSGLISLSLPDGVTTLAGLSFATDADTTKAPLLVRCSSAAITPAVYAMLTQGAEGTPHAGVPNGGVGHSGQRFKHLRAADWE